MTRAFHNTTSRYNGYFNAKEIMKETESNLRENQQDDYSQLLPIFIYPSEKESQALYPKMDKVIEKCSEVIERHSIYLRKKEHVKWIDDSYFLIGKARFYKKEFGLAKETFLYVYQGYKTEEIRYEGLMWLIRSNIETEDWAEVEKYIDLVKDDTKFPEDFKGEYHAILADYNLKRDADHESAIINLEEAIALIDKKKDRVRKAFVLAQLYQQKSDFAKASELYASVVKMRPGFTMEFNAKINRAIAYDVGSNNSENIRKQLLKMLKDEKNKEFRDQIYFALAELELKEGNEDLGISYLQKSAALSTVNIKQKALSYFRLANLFFDKPNYIEAQSYYDSTVQFLPKEHPYYYEADDKNMSLQDLVKNLKVIQLQDSLLALSNMSEGDRLKKIEKMIADKKAEEERERIAEEAKAERALAANRTANTGKGEWYFYNQATLTFGKVEFRQLWGNRELADNWRRHNKESTNMGNQAVARDGGGVAPTEQLSEEENPESYLQNIPTEEKDVLAAHGKIAQALFNVGTIFKESFADRPSAIKSFKRLISEYDTSRYNLPAHYQLYRIYSNMGEEELAEVEKNWVLDNHPFSEYAYLIKNPDYNKNKQETKEKVEAFYAATYNLYEYAMYEDVISSVNKADSIFLKNHIQPKYDLLRAKAIGYSRSREEFKKALQKIVADYPEDSVKLEAEVILRFLNKMESPATASTANYTLDPKDKHYLIVSIASKGSKASAIQNSLSSFNSENFGESKLRVSSTALNEKSIFLVREFVDQEMAFRYIKALRNNARLMAQVQNLKGDIYLISSQNFKILFDVKNEAEYRKFYERRYNVATIE